MSYLLSDMLYLIFLKKVNSDLGLTLTKHSG